MSLVTEQHSMRNPRAVLHWYDFLCPFCYIGQSRNAVLVQHGFHLAELTFQIHPEIPHGGISVGPRKGPMYTMLEREAKEAGLPLHWPRHLPNSLSALAAVFAATAVAVSQTGPRTGPVFTKDGDLVLPTGFREWIRIGSRLRGIGRSCPQLVARTEEAFRFDSTLEDRWNEVLTLENSRNVDTAVEISSQQESKCQHLSAAPGGNAGDSFALRLHRS